MIVHSYSGAGIPLMAAGGGVGVVTVWNLEERKLHTIIRDAHDAPVTRLHFFPGEPRLMSAGAVSDLLNLIRNPLALQPSLQLRTSDL